MQLQDQHHQQAEQQKRPRCPTPLENWKSAHDAVPMTQGICDNKCRKCCWSQQALQQHAEHSSVGFLHFNVDDFYIFEWFVVAVCLSLLDCYHHIIALGHLQADKQLHCSHTCVKHKIPATHYVQHTLYIKGSTTAAQKSKKALASDVHGRHWLTRCKSGIPCQRLYACCPAREWAPW